jgi:hypothetical protein
MEQSIMEHILYEIRKAISLMEATAFKCGGDCQWIKHATTNI